MHHKILDLFATRVSPERMVIYKESVSNLLLKDVALYDLTFDNFYNTVFDNSTIYNVADFDDLLLQHLRASVEEFGVYLEMDMVDANAVEPLTYLMKMLYTYDQYDDQSELIQLMDQSLPSAELIAELVVSVTSFNKAERIMELISDVSTSLPRRMRTVSTEAVERLNTEDDYTNDEIETAKYLSTLSERFGNPHPLSLLQQGWRFGQDINDYAYAMVPNDNDYTPHGLAVFFVLAAVMAKIPRDSIIARVGEYVQSRYDDRPDLMLGISRALNKIDLGD